MTFKYCIKEKWIHPPLPGPFFAAWDTDAQKKSLSISRKEEKFLNIIFSGLIATL